jgi:hypothetical protein
MEERHPDQKIIFRAGQYTVTQDKYYKRIYRLEKDDLGTPYWFCVEIVTKNVSEILDLILNLLEKTGGKS